MPLPNWRPDPSIVSRSTHHVDVAADNQAPDTQGMPVDDFTTYRYQGLACSICEADPQEKFALGKKVSDVIWKFGFPEPLTVQVGDRVRFWDHDENRYRYSRVQKPADNVYRLDVQWLVFAQEVNQ